MGRILERGAVFGRYVIRQKIGKGGMGVVYRARDPRLPRRPVAIKTLSSLAVDDLERFKREAEAISQVSMKSRHIVKIFEYGEFGGVPFIVMEYLQGQTLEARMRSEQLAVESSVGIALGMCSGAWACHKAGILHRDITPKNVFLHVEDGVDVVKLVDFGVSVHPWASPVTSPHHVAGTPRYLAPERLRGDGFDARSDLYSIGIVLYQLLCGRLPFEAPDDEQYVRRILEGTFTPPSAWRTESPPELDAIMATALARHADDRYQTAREFGLALLPYADPAAQASFSAVFSAPARPMVDQTSTASSVAGVRPRGPAVPVGRLEEVAAADAEQAVEAPRTLKEEEIATVRYEAISTKVEPATSGRSNGASTTVDVLGQGTAGPFVHAIGRPDGAVPEGPIVESRSPRPHRSPPPSASRRLWLVLLLVGAALAGVVVGGVDRQRATERNANGFAAARRHSSAADPSPASEAAAQVSPPPAVQPRAAEAAASSSPTPATSRNEPDGSGRVSAGETKGEDPIKRRRRAPGPGQCARGSIGWALGICDKARRAPILD